MYELGAAAVAGSAATTAEAKDRQQASFVRASAAQLALLAEEKASAIAAERYEEAARIRDEMAVLQRKQFGVAAHLPRDQLPGGVVLRLAAVSEQVHPL